MQLPTTKTSVDTGYDGWQQLLFRGALGMRILAVMLLLLMQVNTVHANTYMCTGTCIDTSETAVPTPTGTPPTAPPPTATATRTAAPKPTPALFVMPRAVFDCFAQVQFYLVNGIIRNSYWPTACFEGIGFPDGNVSIDPTYVYNWQQMFPVAASAPAVADQYLVFAYNDHCANCVDYPTYPTIYSQTYPYTYVYKPPN